MKDLTTKFIGRGKEKEILRNALNSNEAEMIAIVGRRRVGKTFLIHSFFENLIKFEVTGVQNGNLQEQLQNFTNRLNIHIKPTVPFETPKNWFAAFHILTLYFEDQEYDEKIVLFFDELPWMASRRSSFLKAFGVFWNSWASRKNIILVICGSAASWMIQKVVRDRGGLHNRITRRVNLQPFTLKETKTYLKSRSLNFTNYQIIQLYMAMGGIPHYLKEIERGQSVEQNIDRIFLSDSGLLNEEFDLLYTALFENAETHIAIIRVLAEKWKGLTRKEIIKIGKFPNGGTTTKVLEELQQSGFIKGFYTFGKKKKGIQYKLIDEYSIFYLKFIEDKRYEEEGVWLKLSQTQAYKIWTGHAFENICFKHVPQIKKALRIGGVYSETSIYRSQANDEVPGTQIDLLIDRNDRVINLFELKFYSKEFLLTKAYSMDLRRKMMVFEHNTKTKKQISWAMLTTFGLADNAYRLDLIDHDLTIDVLFE